MLATLLTTSAEAVVKVENDADNKCIDDFMVLKSKGRGRLTTQWDEWKMKCLV